MHMICAKALAQSGAEVAHDAASYLIYLLARYEIGDDTSLLWLVRDAVAAMAEDWTKSEFEAIEGRVLEVDPPRSAAGWRTSRGHAAVARGCS